MQENTLKTHFSTVHIFILGKRKKEEEKSVVNEANFFRFRAHSLFFDIVCEVYEKKTELNSKLNATARNTPLLLSLSMLIRVNIRFSKDEIWNSKNWICSRIKRNFELDWVLRAEYIFLWCQESDKMTFFLRHELSPPQQPTRRSCLFLLLMMMIYAKIIATTIVPTNEENFGISQWIPMCGECWAFRVWMGLVERNPRNLKKKACYDGSNI